MSKDLQKPAQVVVQELLNRQFQPEDIRQHLLEQGYDPATIEQAFAVIQEAAGRKPEKTITPAQGFRGIYILIGSVAVLIYQLIYKRDSGNPMGDFARIILSIIGIIYGVSLMRRRLK